MFASELQFLSFYSSHLFTVFFLSVCELHLFVFLFKQFIYSFNFNISGIYPGAVSPIIKAIAPSEGWTSGGQSVVIIGENFFDGLQAMIGTATVWCELITPHAMKVTTPPRNTEGHVDVSLLYKSRPVSKGLAGKFHYSCE